MPGMATDRLKATATFQAENLDLQSKTLSSFCPGGSQTTPLLSSQRGSGPQVWPPALQE